MAVSSNTGASKAMPKGMHPQAWQAYKLAFANSGMEPWRIVQTCSGALGPVVAASAGTHDRDGFIGQTALPYSVCVDLSVWRFRGVRRWDEAHIKWCLFNLALNGFAAWYRHTGSFSNNRHIHAVFVGLEMKEQCQRQVVDFLNDRTGLVGHARETFWTASKVVDGLLKTEFLLHNPSAAKFF